MSKTIREQLVNVDYQECEKDLGSNWAQILSAAIGEIFQEVWDLFNNGPFLILPWNWFFQWFGFLRIDLGATYAYSAISADYQARTNLRCAVNFYNGLLVNKKVDYAYEDDITYYLNAAHGA